MTPSPPPSGGGVEELVLHLGEEERGFLFTSLVVIAEGEEVADFLVEAFFRGPDVADAGEEFVEVIPTSGVLEALVVHDEAFDNVFLQMGAGPLSELNTTRGADAVADGEDEIEVIELDRALNLAFSLDLNC